MREQELYANKFSKASDARWAVSVKGLCLHGETCTTRAFMAHMLVSRWFPQTKWRMKWWMLHKANPLILQNSHATQVLCRISQSYMAHIQNLIGHSRNNATCTWYNRAWVLWVSCNLFLILNYWYHVPHPRSTMMLWMVEYCLYTQLFSCRPVKDRDSHTDSMATGIPQLYYLYTNYTVRCITYQLE